MQIVSQKTSAAGVAAIELEESVVLRAYRDAVGVWTIGAGLTRASGVVSPRAGMVISREEAARLLALALERNYEPAVARAMPGAAPHEFDAGVSFHFNTGAIGRASWVKNWRQKTAALVIRARLADWRLADGKVLPGLVKRRAREADMLLLGIYPAALQSEHKASEGMLFARWGLPMEPDEKDRVFRALGSLGYEVGDVPHRLPRGAVLQFQIDHALTIDGIIGRATLSTLERRLAMGRKTTNVAGVSGAGATAAVSGVDDLLDQLPHLGAWAAAAGAAYALYLAFSYRDIVAGMIERRLPMGRLAAFLRSF